MAHATIEQIVKLASGLSSPERLEIIERIAPDLTEERQLDEQYQRGYEQIPEDSADVEALLPLLSLPTEHWE